MKKKFLKLAALAMTLAMVLSACGGSSGQASPKAEDSTEAPTSAGETIHVQWGSTGMDGMAANDAWKWTAEEITKRTDGRIEIEFLNDSALGGDESLLTQMMDGVLDVASIGTSAIGKYTPLFDGMQLPFLITSYENELAMIQSDEMAAIKEAFGQEYGLRVMAIGENGLRHFASTDHAVNTPADLKGMKMRVVPGTVIADAIAVLGANPTTISYNEIYTSLQNKIIDSEEVNYSTISVQKHYVPLPILQCLPGWDSQRGYPHSSMGIALPSIENGVRAEPLQQEPGDGVGGDVGVLGLRHDRRIAALVDGEGGRHGDSAQVVHYVRSPPSSSSAGSTSRAFAMRPSVAGRVLRPDRIDLTTISDSPAAMVKSVWFMHRRAIAISSLSRSIRTLFLFAGMVTPPPSGPSVHSPVQPTAAAGLPVGQTRRCSTWQGCWRIRRT